MPSDTPKEPDPIDPHETMVRATMTMKELFQTFERTAALGGFPTQIETGKWLLFQQALAVVALSNQAGFQGEMVSLLAELVERTRAVEGGLDLRAIQRELSLRKVATAMGPDVEVLQALVQESNYAQSLQDQQIALLQGKIEQMRLGIESVLRVIDVSQGDLLSLHNTKAAIEELLREVKDPTQDPGAIPEGVRTDGTEAPHAQVP